MVGEAAAKPWHAPFQVLSNFSAHSSNFWGGATAIPPAGLQRPRQGARKKKGQGPGHTASLTARVSLFYLPILFTVKPSQRQYNLRCDEPIFNLDYRQTSKGLLDIAFIFTCLLVHGQLRPTISRVACSLFLVALFAPDTSPRCSYL